VIVEIGIASGRIVGLGIVDVGFYHVASDRLCSDIHTDAATHPGERATRLVGELEIAAVVVGWYVVRPGLRETGSKPVSVTFCRLCVPIGLVSRLCFVGRHMVGSDVVRVRR
jgi:hypothetical protein